MPSAFFMGVVSFPIIMSCLRHFRFLLLTSSLAFGISVSCLWHLIVASSVFPFSAFGIYMSCLRYFRFLPLASNCCVFGISVFCLWYLHVLPSVFLLIPKHYFFTLFNNSKIPSAFSSIPKG